MALTKRTKDILKVGFSDNKAGKELATAMDAATATIVSNAAAATAYSDTKLTWADVTLSTAQILALNTTPITLVAAPGAGKAILVDSAYSSLVYGTTTYACDAAGASLKYTNGSGAAVGIALTQAFIQTATGTALLHVRGAATALVPVVNAPIVIQAATTDPTTGNSAIKIRVYYRVVNAPLF